MVNSFNLNRKDFYNEELESIWTPTRERDFYLQTLGDTEENRKLPLTFLSMKYLEDIIGVPRSSYNVMWSFSDYINNKSFLSQFTDTALALSLQKLSKEPTNVVRVRRSSDNAEQDFNANEVKGTGLLDFVVPTDVQAKYNNAVWFDGVDDFIDVGTQLLPLTGDWKISYKILLPIGYTSSANRFVVSQHLTIDDGRFAVGVNTAGNSFLFLAGDNVNGVALNDGNIHKMAVTRVGDTLTLYVDDVSQGTLTFSGSLTNTNTGIGIIQALDRYFIGSFWDLEFDIGNNGIVNHRYLGTGNTNADWQDQIGSNDGTVVGSPALFTGQGFNGTVSRMYDQRVSTDNCVAYMDRNHLGISNVSIGADDDFFYESKAIFSQFTELRSVLSESSGGFDRFSFTNATTFRIRQNQVAYDIALDITLEINKPYKYRIERNSNVFSIYINGVLQTNTVSVPNDAFRFLYLGGFERIHGGAIYDINLNDQHAWSVRGSKLSDIVDTIGSNNATFRVPNPPRLSLADYVTVSRDLVQTTTANQPLIVENGALKTDGGKPAIHFKTATQAFLSPIPIPDLLTSESFGAYVVYKPTDLSDTFTVFRNVTSSDHRFNIVQASNDLRVAIGIGTGAPVGSKSGNIIVNTRYLVGATHKDSDFTLRLNGTPQVGDNSPSMVGAINQGRMSVMIRTDGSWGNVGFMQELIIMGTDENKDGIYNNINRRWQVF